MVTIDHVGLNRQLRQINFNSQFIVVNTDVRVVQ